MILYIIIIISFFFIMELIAWLTHKYVMHGFLWELHEDHHRYHSHWYEKNDLFTLFFLSLAVIFIALGHYQSNSIFLSMGIGITLYGMGYFLFHDIMFHRRLKWLKIKANHPYLKRIIKAHSVHHQTSTKEKGQAFGFLIASHKYDV